MILLHLLCIDENLSAHSELNSHPQKPQVLAKECIACSFVRSFACLLARLLSFAVKRRRFRFKRLPRLTTIFSYH